MQVQIDGFARETKHNIKVRKWKCQILNLLFSKSFDPAAVAQLVELPASHCLLFRVLCPFTELSRDAVWKMKLQCILHLLWYAPTLICTYSYMHLLSPAYILICTYSYLYIILSAHTPICTYPYDRGPICTHSCLHILLSAHSLVCTYSCLHIILRAHTLVCTYSCLHILLSAHSLVCT